VSADGGPLAWVVGRAGLLGSHLESALGGAGIACWTGAPRFDWLAPESLASQFADALARFRVASRQHDGWLILWAAGSGVVDSTVETLERESQSLRTFLALADPLPPGRGAFFLASSAGGVHAGCQDAVIDERSPCKPMSPYGEAKARQEQLLIPFAEARRLPYLVGRIANLYGPNQNMGKPQGFISQLIRSVIQDLPFHIYVPLDTIRDFVYADDCAGDIVTALLALQRRQAGGVIKILASEETTPLSRVIHCVGAVARRTPRIVSAYDTRRARQPSVLRFRSVVLTELERRPRTTLEVGASRVYQYQLRLFCQGRLPRRA
jgi:UDP-glucose 4-epimerase